MSNLKADLTAYLGTKQNIWSTSTLRTASAKLFSLIRYEFDAQHLFKKLAESGYSRYTIKTYFILAAGFEQHQKKNYGFGSFLKTNAFLFRNCYKEKTFKLDAVGYEKLINEALSHSPEMYNFIYLMGSCGLRLSEAKSVKWSDLENDVLTVEGKGDKRRFVPCKAGRLMKTSSKTIVGETINPYFLFRNLPPVTPHSLRAFFLTSMLERGLNIKEVAVLAGHSSVLTTQKYIRTDFDEIKRKVLSNGTDARGIQKT